MYKLKTFNLILLTTMSSMVYGQNLEMGGMIGASNYHGDLASEIVLEETHAAAGLFIKQNMSRYWSWRNALTVGRISGSDENFKEYELRNLHFQSDIVEFSSTFEFNYLPFGANILTEDFSSYLFAGIGVFYFNPKTQYGDNTYELRDLRTEGQNSDNIYSRIQFCIPFGGGIKYNINKNWVFGWELGWRKTFTDYLDDVSTTYPNLADQRDRYGDLSANLSDRSWELSGIGEPLSGEGDMRGDPNFKDFYFISGFTLAYRFTPIQCWPRYRKDFLFK